MVAQIYSFCQGHLDEARIDETDGIHLLTLNVPWLSFVLGILRPEFDVEKLDNDLQRLSTLRVESLEIQRFGYSFVEYGRYELGGFRLHNCCRVITVGISHLFELGDSPEKLRFAPSEVAMKGSE